MTNINGALSVADAMTQLAIAIEAENRRNASRNEMLSTLIVNLEKADPTAELAVAMRDYVVAERPKLASPHPVAISPEGVTQAARDVLAERRRQVEAEGWTPEHDDAHSDYSLTRAAITYAKGATTGAADRALMDEFGATGTPFKVHRLWPWDPKWFKPKDRRRDLVKAAALILAEIERLDRRRTDG